MKNHTPYFDREEHVVIVDDDAVTRFLIGSALRDNHITTYECDSAESLFELLEERRIDVIILDLVLPQINGIDALSYLRTSSDVGVIMISSHANSRQRLQGLREGADDFICTPVSTDELVYKVQSLAARVQIQRGHTEAVSLELDNCEILIQESSIISKDNQTKCPLTESELRILVSLIQRANKVCHRKLLQQCISSSELTAVNARSIDTLISRIRNKLSQFNCAARVSSVRGQGYRLDHPESP